MLGSLLCSIGVGVDYLSFTQTVIPAVSLGFRPFRASSSGFIEWRIGKLVLIELSDAGSLLIEAANLSNHICGGNQSNPYCNGALPI